MPPRSAGPRSRSRSPSRSAAAKRHAVPRRAEDVPCVKYRRTLDKLLPPEWSEAVYTENAADVIDRPLVATLQLSPERETNVRTLFKKRRENPKILIVTRQIAHRLRRSAAPRQTDARPRAAA